MARAEGRPTVWRKPEANLRVYEQKPHTRPVCPGEWATGHRPQVGRETVFVQADKRAHTDGGSAEPVQGKFTFLSGEICPTYLGVGLARKPGPCMRKQLGVGQKSAKGIVLDPIHHSDEEGRNEMRKYVPC